MSLRPPPIGLTILTGFLGAGKTTFLNRLLGTSDAADIAVVVNEFGEIGIDHLLVEHADEGLVELSSGCICCTMRGDLARTLENLLRRLDNGRLGRLRRVIVETTGLADPAPLLHTVMRHPYLALRYRLDGVVTIVDALNGPATLDTHEEAVKQVAVADRLVLTKTDLLAGGQDTAPFRRRLARLAPAAAIMTAGSSEAVSDLLGATAPWDAGTKSEDVRRWLADEAVRAAEPDHARAHEEPSASRRRHHGAPHRHDARFRTMSLTSAAAITAPAFAAFLDLLRAAHGPNLLRLKGLVRLAEDPDRPLVVHAVQHVLHPPLRLAGWPDADHRTRLVAITCDLDDAVVRRLFAALVGEIGPDTPDRAALFDNPLAVPGVTMSRA